MSDQIYDCVVCGTSVLDVLVRTVPLDTPIGAGRLFEAEPLRSYAGGIVANSGAAMAKLGLRVAAMTLVGDDEPGRLFTTKIHDQGVDICSVDKSPTVATSTSAVLVDQCGQRSFAHYPGAASTIDFDWVKSHRDLLRQSRAMLVGYYSLLPRLEADLPRALEFVRGLGCLIALDSAGDGGDPELLKPCLPHLDFYVPSYDEAICQTSRQDPHEIIQWYRDHGCEGVVGVKLGADGALISGAEDHCVAVDACTPPGDVVDTTGAGDCFFGALITGVLRGMNVDEASRLASAAGACCVSAEGPQAGLQDFKQTCAIAGLTPAEVPQPHYQINSNTAKSRAAAN